MVREWEQASPRIRIVIDCSGSMSGGRLASAQALSGALYLSLRPAEQRDVEWYAYTTTLRQISASDVPRLQASGGTSLACLQPQLDASEPHDRWLVITDGDVPDLHRIAGKLAVIVIGQRAPDDPRCIEWSSKLESDRLALERACRRLQALMR